MFPILTWRLKLEFLQSRLLLQIIIMFCIIFCRLAPNFKAWNSWRSPCFLAVSVSEAASSTDTQMIAAVQEKNILR